MQNSKLIYSLNKISSRLALTAAIAFTTPAFAAYYGVLDDGEVLGAGKYKLTADAQALTEDGGLNASAAFDLGFQDEFGLRGLAGFGKTDFFAGAMFKWMPIPDLENQPAMGFNIGLIYAGRAMRNNDQVDGSALTFRLEPLLSKKIQVEQTTITPYVSLPIGIRMNKYDSKRLKDDTDIAWQLVLGSQLQLEDMKNLQFIGEVGLNLDQSPSYISVGAIWFMEAMN